MLECRNKKTPVMVANIQKDFIFILSSYYVAKMFQARGRISPTFIFSLSFNYFRAASRALFLSKKERKVGHVSKSGS